MTVDRAFRLFDSRAAASGLAAPEAGSNGSRVVEATSGEAVLRLRWDETFGVLELEINHGPADGPPVGWMDLYGAELVADELRPDQSDYDFESAIDHGFSLLIPNR